MTRERNSDTGARSILASLAEAVVVYDANGLMNEANPAAEKLLMGLLENLKVPIAAERDRVLRSDGTVFPFEELPGNVVLKTGRPVRNVELGLRDLNGDVRWLLVSAAPLGDQGEGREVVVSFLDVTVWSAEKATLIENATRFRSMFELSPVGVGQADVRTGRILLVNDRFCEITGYSREELLSSYVRNLTHPEDREADWEKFQRMVRGETPEYENEKRYIRKDGRVIWVHLMSRGMRDSTGNIVRSIGIVQDITQRKESEAALREAKGSAERANRAKDTFLAVLSHELRTPLTAILSWAQMLKQMLKTGKFEPGKVTNGLQTIEDAALSQNQLINDLLDISRISTGKVFLETRDADLTAIVRKAIDTVRAAAERKSIRLVEQLASEPLFVIGDPARLLQIVWNLLGNSIKFTQPGGLITIAVGADRETAGESRAWIRVQDTGAGISREFLPKIFELFSQGDSSSVRIHGGLGIGLALVHSLTQLQGGTVEVQSEGEGKGAVFTVKLPLSSAMSFDEHKKFDADTPGSPGHADLTGVRLLLVDDDVRTLQSIEEVLSSAGALVRSVSSAEAAIAEFEKSTPEIIVSDIAMPVEDGYSLIRKIRKLSDEKGGHTPALALTAYADSASRNLALAAGYQEHLAKPVDSDRLVRTILALIA